MVGVIFPKKYVETAYFYFQLSEGTADVDSNGVVYWTFFTEDIFVEKVEQMGWKVDFYIKNNFGGDYVMCAVLGHNEIVWNDGSDQTSFVVGPTLYTPGEYHFGVTSMNQNVEIYIWVDEWKSTLPFFN